jgi:magnesium-protoporphyrin IX monomethyl ester (oxidative) cyclase
MGKLLLLSPPLYCEKHLRRSFQPPLNLLYLYSYLKQKNIEVELVETDSTEDAVKKILESTPDLVGIPLYYASLTNVFEIVQRVRSKSSAIRFVAGGPCLTMEPERMMLEGSFDFGVIGEGEETLCELFEALTKGLTFASIAGLVYREGGEIVANTRRAAIADLDKLPFLDFSAVDNDYYFNFQLKSGVPKTLFLNSSRGCSFRCSYCCTPVLWPGPVRRYSPGRMVDEIKHQLRIFPGVEIGFCDDSFFSDRSWLNEFLELVRPLSIKFQCIGRADHLKPQSIAELVKAGMNYIAFGVETGNCERQKKLQKNLNLNLLFETMRELRKYEVKTKCFFMLGFPDETVDEMVDTINLAVELRRLGMDYFSIFPVSVYPGTELARQFPSESFASGLDAHMPEIIRDGLEIDLDNQALLNKRFNQLLNQRQMIDVISFAWEKVDRAEKTCIEELAALISSAVDEGKG